MTINIISKLDPFSIFIEKGDSEVTTIKELINNIIKILELENLLDNVIDEDKNNKFLLLSDTFERLLVKTYGIKSFYITKPIKKSDIRSFSKNVELLLKKVCETLQSDVGKTKLSINELLLYFKNIEENRSDNNYFIKELIKYLNETTKYNDYTLIYNENKFKVVYIKCILLLLSSLLFPKEKYSSYFKLTSIAFNGILSNEEVNYSENNKISEVIITKLRETYTNGNILYLSKIIAYIMKVYDFISKDNDTTIKKELMSIISDDKITLSSKYNGSIELLFKSYDIKKTIKEGIEETFYIPFLIPEYKDDEKKYSYEEYKKKIKEIEKVGGNDIETLLIQELLKTKAKDSIPKIIELNKQINSDLNNAITNYPEVLEDLLIELNTSICATIGVQIFSFPESLGKFFIESKFLLATGTKLEKKLSDCCSCPCPCLCGT